MTAKKQSTEQETVEQSDKVDRIALVNTGKAVLIIDGKRVLPKEEIDVTEAYLSRRAIRSLVFRGELTVKDNSALNKQVADEHAKLYKPDETQRKTVKELEDGGVYS